MSVERENSLILEEAIDIYMELLPEMLKKHEGEWVVIKAGEKKPLGFSKTQKRIYKKALRTYGNIPVLLRQVSREYEEYGRYGKTIFTTRNLGV